MSWPRLAGHEYRLTPERQGEPYEWRHTTLVTRPPHRRVARMRANLNRVPLGPPPTYTAHRLLGPAPHDYDTQETVRRWIDGYAAALKRRRLTAGGIDVRLVDGDLPNGPVLLIAEYHPTTTEIPHA